MHLNSSTRRLAACALALAALPLAASAQVFGGSRNRPAPTVVQVGVIHPVESDPIEDGVLVIEGGAIRAIGKRSEVEIPEGAKVLDFPGAHAYPGLVDAQSGGFCATNTLRAQGGDAGSNLEDALDYRDPLSRNLAEHGVTTSYVASRAQTRWRGIGAYVRSTPRGGRPVRNAPEAAVHMSLTAAPGTHSLNRAEQLRDVGKPFDALKAYEKSRKKFDKAVGEYEEKFDEYIDYHESQKDESEDAEKKDKKKDDKPDGESPKKDAKEADAPKKDEPQKDPPEKDVPEEDKPEKDKPEKGDDETDGDKPASRRGRRAASRTGGKKPTSGKSAKRGGKSDKKDEKAPERPKYPKPPTDDPAKEALIEVRDGKRALRVEARRIDEIRTALTLKRERAIDSMILEGVDAASRIAKEIAEAGVPVVVTRVEPREDSPFGDDDVIADNLRCLHDAGVKIAIGSGNSLRARNLPLVAARAAALGLGDDAAIRAITLDAAQILGVSDRVGSLAPNKAADILITSGPLLASQTKILQVILGGRPILDVD